jgi:hypothetical protein
MERVLASDLMPYTSSSVRAFGHEKRRTVSYPKCVRADGWHYILGNGTVHSHSCENLRFSLLSVSRWYDF